MIEPLSHPFMQRALAEVLILALVCGPLSCWVLFHRQGYGAESLSHAMFPGLAVAAAAGLPLLVGAAVGTVVAAGAIGALAGSRRIDSELAVAVVVTGLFGLGALIALSPSTPPRLSELLFGDPIGVGKNDLLASSALALGGLVTLLATHRKLTLTAFDPSVAQSLKTNPRRAQLVVLVVMAVTTVAAVQAMGNLLVLALLVVPAAAARKLTDRLSRTLLLSTGLTVIAGVGGLYLSYHAEIAGGAAIALSACAIYLLSTAAARNK